MLRITEIAEPPSAIVLKLEGQIISDWVAELERLCREALERHTLVRLDFAGVTMVDRRGAAMLKMLPHERLSFVNCPPLIRAVVDGDQGE